MPYGSLAQEERRRRESRTRWEGASAIHSSRLFFPFRSPSLSLSYTCVCLPFVLIRERERDRNASILMRRVSADDYTDYFRPDPLRQPRGTMKKRYGLTGADGLLERERGEARVRVIRSAVVFCRTLLPGLHYYSGG